MKKKELRPFACRKGSYLSRVPSDDEIAGDNQLARRAYLGQEQYQNSSPVSRLDLVQQRNSTEVV